MRSNLKNQLFEDFKIVQDIRKLTNFNLKSITNHFK